MPLNLPSDVRETTTTTGTGAYLLAGAVSGYWAVGDRLANGDTALFGVRMGANLEVFLGTYASGPNTVARTTIFRSTNGDAAVNWAAGIKDVYITNVGPSDLTDAVKHLYVQLLEPAASDITNDSSVTGATVKEALQNIQTDITASRETAIRVSALPIQASGLFKWNAASHIQDNLCTFEISAGVFVQYCTFVDFDHNPQIARRVLPDGVWTTFALSGVAGNPLDAPFAEDSHNTVAVAVDSDGYIHVAGNHHNTPLQYMRSDSPDDIENWTGSSMVGVNEDDVTYPAFITRRDGTLLFGYRNGVSGDGNFYLNVYDTATETWSALHHPLINGTGTGENPYLWHIPVDDTDVIHIGWCWRGTGAPDTNNDFCYAKSLDGGTTWKKADGSSQTLPITHLNAEVAVNTTASGSGLLNQGGMEVDADGLPHAAVFLYDGGSITQINHVWWDGAAWQVDPVTEFTRGIVFGPSITDGAIMRPFVFCTAANRVYFGFAHKYTKRRGSLRCIDVTPGVTQYVEFRIADLDFNEAELVFDTQALYRRDELHILAHPALNGLPAEESEDVWRNQTPLVLTFDLSVFDRVQAGMVEIPWIEPLIHVAVNSPLNITSTTPTGTFAKLSLPEAVLEQGLIFVKHQARGVMSAGAATMHVYLLETDETAGPDTIYGTLFFAGTSNKNLGTPWMPLRGLAELTYGTYGITGYMNGQAKLSAGGSTGQINIHQIQVGVLRLAKP